MPLLLHVLHLSYTAGLLLKIEACVTTQQALLCLYSSLHSNACQLCHILYRQATLASGCSPMNMTFGHKLGMKNALGYEGLYACECIMTRLAYRRGIDHCSRNAI